MSGQSEHSHEERVRLKAYEIWLNEGKPEGRDARHWEMAREIVGYEDARRSTLEPATGSPGPVEPAVALESMGDVPELTDLGEGQRGPRRGGKAAAPLAPKPATPKAAGSRGAGGRATAAKADAGKGADQSNSVVELSPARNAPAAKAGRPRSPRKTS